MKPFATRTVLPTQTWPAALGGQPARIAALLYQVERSQWWPAEDLRAMQFRQLHALLGHAARTVPYHRRRLRDAGFDPTQDLTAAVWARIPILTRQDVQAQGPRMHAGVVPPEHGEISDFSTGGSSGIPVRIRGTAAQSCVYWAAFLRDARLHGEDLAAPTARIGRNPAQFTPAQEAAVQGPNGLTMPSAGAPLDWLFTTGPIHMMEFRRNAAELVAFLARSGAATLVTIPSTLRLLLTHLRDEPRALPHLRFVRTNTETVDAALRQLCRDVTGARIIDTYSANDGGILATQCPLHDHLHVAAEGCLVEVLDADGRACAPGEVGRVVITPLHNFATPLIRYELGDRAEIGPPCPCGRGLPVLNRILGRSYDAVVLADGSRRSLTIGHFMATLAPVREFQLVQTVPGEVEIRMVVSRPPTEAEAGAAIAHVQSRSDPSLVIRVVVCDQLPRTPAGKLRVFVSELAGA